MTDLRKKAIRVQMINIEPMTLFEYNRIMGIQTDKSIVSDDEGFVIHEEDGLKWIDSYKFNKSYFILNENYKVTKDEVSRFIKLYDSFDFDEKTTLVTSETISGFKLNEFSSCVSKEIYDRKIGEKIAFERIVDKLYDYLGFILHWAKNGLSIRIPTDKIKIEERIKNI